MSSLFESLSRQLGGTALPHISQRIGADEGKAGMAVAAALPTILAALSRNASKPEGAASLHQALEKDHEGAQLGDLGSFIDKANSQDGAGILRHLFGAKQQRVESSLSRTTGLDSQRVGKLLMTLAPVVMAALAQKRRDKNLDPGSLANLLGEERHKIERQTPAAANLLGSLLDADGDGDVDMSDIAQKGAGMLGKLFGR